MMLAVAPVENLWKKNFRLSRAEFDKIALRPDVSPNILSPNNRVFSSRFLFNDHGRKFI